MPESKVDNSANFNVVDLNAIDDDKSGNSDKKTIDSFFEELDRQVNGSVYDESEVKVQQPVAKQEEIDGEQKVEPITKPDLSSDDYQTLKKRYEDSSKEGKRLASELKAMKQYEDYYKRFAPLLETLNEDQDLQRQMRDYVVSKGQQPISKKLELPEGFIFDMEEALSDPNSVSAKVLDNVVDSRVNSTIGQRAREHNQLTKEQAAEALVERQKEELKVKYNVTDEYIDSLLDWAVNKQMTLEDAYILKERPNRDKTIADNINKERLSQASKAASNPPTIGGKGSTGGEKIRSAEEILFSQILKTVGGQDYF